MNKNLKKVISTVAALAISASAVSAFAVDFPDVPADSNYYQAVQELSAVGVISGFDDGTFRPDELVTRAQITKMIVDALSETESAEASKANSKFADVSADHWAKGYINQGVADEFIAGYSDTEFGPDDNVTYVQAQKMLVSAMGYETYAQNNGGWPNGYKMYAASQGVTEGISGIADDQQLTRAQVARLIDNAMNSPVCVIDDYETLLNGTVAPKLKIKDGEGKEYQTLFTKKHDAYKVYGRVMETNRSNNGNVDTDKVVFRVEKADNFNDKYVTAANAADYVEDMFIGDTNADQMEGVYAQALVQKNDNDEWTILSIVAAAAGKSVDLATDDYDKTEGKSVYFFPAGTTRNSTKYELADTVTYYVNGVYIGTTTDPKTDIIDVYVDNNTTGEITLMKSSGVGTTSSVSKYDTVYVTVYGTAVVEQVTDKSDVTTIGIKETSRDITKSQIKFEKDDDSYKYTITLNGEAIDAADLQEDDVLTIAYDRTTDFDKSKFYDVYVSRDTASGRYKGTSGDDGYKVDGTVYKFAQGIAAYNFQTSTDYTLYLDVFGKIAFVDEESSSKKIGILKSVYRKNNGDYEAEIINKSATVETYTMDFDENKAGGAWYVADHFNGTAVDGTTYNAKLSKENKDFYNQVVEYKTTSAGKLTIKQFMVGKEAGTDANKGADALGWGKYKESTNRLGSLRLSSSTTILDLTSEKDDVYSVITESNLDNDAAYKAFGYDYNNSDSSYRYVLVLDDDNEWNSKTQLAVFVEQGTDTNADGDEIDTITVMYNGEDQLVTLALDEDKEVPAGLVAGDAIVFSTTTAGDVNEIVKVFKDGVNLFGGDYDAFRRVAVANMANANDILSAAVQALDLSDADEDNVDIQFGILVRDGNGVALVTDFNDITAVSLDDAQNLNTSNAKVYTYNFKNGTKNNGRFVLDDGVQKSSYLERAFEGRKAQNIYNFNYDGDNDGVYDVDLVFAVVRTFDNDEAQEIYQIVKE